jgi:DNA repair protein RadD
MQRKFEPRHYQISACAAGVDWIKNTIDPGCIMAPTGAGKALLCAMLALEYLSLCQGKNKVLILVPSATLVKQNYKTFLDYSGLPCSKFSASAGEKCLRHSVVIGTPQTVINSIDSFKGFGFVIIDESHETTPTIKSIIESLREKNQYLRVIGCSATPFRLGQGYIYKNHYLKGKLSETQCSDSSYYHSLIYEISARMLIDEGYLTMPVFDHAEISYDTSCLTLNKMGNFDSESVQQAFAGKGRLTSDIVADVVEKSVNRNCVLWFAATIQHAHEIAESLPISLTRVVTGETPKKELERVLDEFRRGLVRHVINVSMLHRGFDAPNIDTIAVLRATESAALYLQIIGRGLRLDESKNECLILDYAGNVERHAPHGDIFDPEITAPRSSGGEKDLEVECPLCLGKNMFAARPNEEGYKITKNGYFADLQGIEIEGEFGPIPAHYGRRCKCETIAAGLHTQCTYRWTFKPCPVCEVDNDIGARYCCECKAELIDPNEKLRIESERIASDPYSLKISNVSDIRIREWPSKGDKPNTIRVDYIIDKAPKEVSEWFSPHSESDWARAKYREFVKMYNLKGKPLQVAYKKEEGNGYFKVKKAYW